MEELRDRLEEIAELISQKEQEIGLLRQDLEAIRLALEVQEEMDEEPVQEEVVQDEIVEEEVSTEEPIAEEIEDPAVEEVHEEPSEIEVKVAEQDTIMHAIDTLTQEMEATGISANEHFEEGQTVGDKASASRVSDLKKAIGLNERFLFANELFNGDVQALSRAIEELNHVEQNDAERLINEDLANRYKWDHENTTVITFKSLVARRFI